MPAAIDPIVLIIPYAISQPGPSSAVDLLDIVSPNPAGPMVESAQINKTTSKMMMVALEP